ncbi:MAG: type II secretion system F family protein [Planctomycetota bacterium]|nr:type II secretion system F family protein [Planctomycetota bacterium]
MIAIVLAVEDMTGTGQMVSSVVLGVLAMAVVLVGYRPFKGVVAAREAGYERDLQGALMIDVRPRSVTYLTGLGMVLMAVTGFLLLGGWVGGAMGLIAGVFLPSLAIGYLRRRRVAKLDQQLVSSIRTLASGVRAGLNLVQAMQLVARDGADPVRQEYNHMMREYEYGVPLETAMSNAARRIGSSDYQLLFAALLTHRERGGDLGETLDRIAESILEIQRLESRVKTLTAQGRTTARWLATMPAVVLGILYLIDHTWVERLFALQINGHANVVGNLILGTIVILNIAGYVWIRKIVAIDI